MRDYEIEIGSTTVVLLPFFLFSAMLLWFPRIWGEAFIPRAFHHLDRKSYVRANRPKRSQPLFHVFKGIMPPSDASTITSLLKNMSAIGGSNSVSYWASWFMLAQYSQRSTLYKPDFDGASNAPIRQLCEEFAMNTLRPKFEKVCGKKLQLSNSDFRIVALRYEGQKASFRSHLDNEPFHYYRSLTLVHVSGNPPCFFRLEEENESGCSSSSSPSLGAAGSRKKNIMDVDLKLGDTIFFQGSMIEHGVRSSVDSTSERYMIGFQWKPVENHKDDGVQDEEFEPDSFCNKLRHAPISTHVLELFWPTTLYNLLFIACFEGRVVDWIGAHIPCVMVEVDWRMYNILMFLLLVSMGNFTVDGASALFVIMCFCSAGLLSHYMSNNDNYCYGDDQNLAGHFLLALMSTVWVFLSVDTKLTGYFSRKKNNQL